MLDVEPASVVSTFVNSLRGFSVLTYSPGMLAQAAKRGVYDDLRIDNATTALLVAPVTYDLVLAADIFVYIGDLTPVFVACAGALRPGGRLAFSTESAGGVGFQLRASGRFAHALAYILNLAEQTGFTAEYCEAVPIRLEKGLPLPGHVFVLRR